MSEPRLLGDIIKEYVANSDDDYARAIRQLYKEHGTDLVQTPDPQKKENHDK
ncbi:MAG: hypothetical protein IJZ70_00670 [Bacteroidales bacterium]|nr:hypothetical protein [Bacteroidales bacterium]